MLDLKAAVEAPRFTGDYFKSEPYRDTGGLDYYSGEFYDSPPAYWFVHTFSTAMQAIIDQGMQISCIEEFEHDISNNWPHLSEAVLRLLLCYQLTAKKYLAVDIIFSKSSADRPLGFFRNCFS